MPDLPDEPPAISSNSGSGTGTSGSGLGGGASAQVSPLEGIKIPSTKEPRFFPLSPTVTTAELEAQKKEYEALVSAPTREERQKLKETSEKAQEAEEHLEQIRKEYEEQFGFSSASKKDGNFQDDLAANSPLKTKPRKIAATKPLAKIQNLCSPPQKLRVKKTTKMAISPNLSEKSTSQKPQVRDFQFGQIFTVSRFGNILIFWAKWK